MPAGNPSSPLSRFLMCRTDSQDADLIKPAQYNPQRPTPKADVDWMPIACQYCRLIWNTCLGKYDVAIILSANR